MKIKTDVQYNLVYDIALEMLKQEQIDSFEMNVDLETLYSKSIINSIKLYNEIMENESMTVTEKHSIFIAAISKLIIENVILTKKLESMI